MNAVEKAMAGYDFYECRAWGHKWAAGKPGRSLGLYLQMDKPNTATLKHVGRVSVCRACDAQRIEQFEVVLWTSGTVRHIRRKPAVYTYSDGYKLDGVTAYDSRTTARETLIYEFGRSDGW